MDPMGIHVDKFRVLGPRLLYRDFTDCAQHVTSHPGPVRLNYLRLAVRGPLRVYAPLRIGFKHFLNSAHPFGGASVETTCAAAVFARDGRFQPYAGVLPALHSFTWQRFRRRKKPQDSQLRLVNMLPIHLEALLPLPPLAQQVQALLPLPPLAQQAQSLPL